MRPDVTPATAATVTAYTVLPITLVLALLVWIYPVAHHHRHVLAPEPAPTSPPARR